ncbi:hypothetical protein [Caudoviricetes sp.]|nr:hypothetical protein [Caudoviricetes sp.]
MDWKLKLNWKLIRDEASEYDLDPFLVAAIIGQESKGDTYAIRYEAHFRYRKEPYRYARLNNISEETENLLQSCSIGLMQVMGCRARELGHKGSLLELVEPEVGIEYGCTNLQHLYLKFDKGTDVVAAYNAGSPLFEPSGKYKNQTYVNKVFEYYNELKRGVENGR